jgi:PAS domain S-box-containing protein
MVEPISCSVRERHALIDDSERDESIDRHARQSVFPGGPRATAWVLEDSPQQAVAVEAALRPLLEVRLFHDSPQLLEALASEQPDVLILDWHVPEISGLEVLEVVRQTHDEVTLPALMLTASRDERAGAIEALAAGANDYANKPIEAGELRARVSTLVRVRILHARARRAERELAEALAREAAARADAVAEREKTIASEERLRRVLEASGAGLWDLDAATGHIDADPRMMELMGCPGQSSMTLDSGLRVVHPEDAQKITARVQGALRGDNHGSYAMEFRTGGRDGLPLRWVESRAQASFDEAGVGTRLAGAMIDVTARKQAELEREALLAREAEARAHAQREREKLYNVFTQAPVAMCVLEGPRHVFSFANTAYRSLVNDRDVVGKPLLEALPDLAGMGFETMLDSVIETGEPVVVKEMPIRLQDHRADESLILNFTYTAKTNEFGERDGVVMFGWDVTEQVIARQRTALLSAQKETSEAQLRLITDAIPLLVSFVAADETYGFANRAYEDWFGIASRDLVGRKVRDVIGEAAYAVLEPYVKRGLAGERFSFEQHGVPYRTGGERDVRVTFVPLALARGEAGGYLALLEDITAPRALEAERERLRRDRTEALVRQSEFEQQLIGIVSHDLRTPLNVITLSAAQIIARGEGLSATVLKNVRRIQGSTERAVRMVSDLLDFTQARLGGGIRIERRPTDVRALLASLLTEVEASYPGREIVCTHEGSGQGDWDPERVSQLVQNLLTNALKYSAAGSAVELDTKTDGAWLTLRVHNTGDAIPAAKLALLFEPLQRGVENVDRVSRSVGLGLYIVQKIAEAHAGTVHVESTDALGTTFTVKLPVNGPALPA